ncbi:hypothetical protein EXS45_01590 [Candidatus Nomurabacteria bacterium]|nr:hypothetical protein [Candidatus Nomurabacteria bacterium]
MMDKLKFALFSIITLTLLGLFGYWSVITLQSGTEHKTSEKISQLQNENKDLKKEVEKQKNELSALRSKLEEFEKPAPIIEEEPEVIVYKHQDLINELQKLTDINVLLKEKSNGLRVGTVQRFLNIYNKTSNKVDNDYGENTRTAVMAFQKDQGMKADGETGPSTFKKMIEWLKKQG